MRQSSFQWLGIKLHPQRLRQIWLWADVVGVCVVQNIHIQDLEGDFLNCSWLKCVRVGSEDEEEGPKRGKDREKKDLWMSLGVGRGNHSKRRRRFSLSFLQNSAMATSKVSRCSSSLRRT